MRYKYIVTRNKTDAYAARIKHKINNKMTI